MIRRAFGIASTVVLAVAYSVVFALDADAAGRSEWLTPANLDPWLTEQAELLMAMDRHPAGRD